MQQAERGLFDLRRGKCVHLSGDNADYLAAAVEGLSEQTLGQFRDLCGGGWRLVLTAHRARSQGLDVPDDAAGVGLVVPSTVGLDTLTRLAVQPTGVLDQLQHELLVMRSGDAAALALVRASLLVPAVLTAEFTQAEQPALRALVEKGHMLSVPVHEARRLGSYPEPGLSLVSEASVPLADSDESRFLLFRESSGLLEHIAVVIGNPADWPDPVPVRLHSACLTGDLFGSLRCDCGDQLRSGVSMIAKAGGGVLLYLAQEGRGIGLANKLRAYAIQDEGMDTVDADQCLGFGQDERVYEAAVQMLKHLGLKRVSLFTNNPAKLHALNAAGIRVTERRALHGTLNSHNSRYLTAKAKRSGHLLEALLNPQSPDP